MIEVEQQIREAHLINWSLFVLKTVIEKLPLTEHKLNNYLFLRYKLLIERKNEMKEIFKKHDIKILSVDKDLRSVFTEAENLAKSSFSHRAIGFISAVYPELMDINGILNQIENLPKDDITFSYQQFKDLLENPE